MPSLAILFPVGTRVAAVGEKDQRPRTENVFDGEHVPGVMGKDVDDQQVDIVECIESLALAVGAVRGTDLVTVVAFRSGAFYLGAPALPAGIDDVVVTVAVSPRFGDAKADFLGFR